MKIKNSYDSNIKCIYETEVGNCQHRKRTLYTTAVRTL